MKLSTVSEIIYNSYLEMRTPAKHNSYTLPFVNCRHRSRIRVVDVYPPELELFAHSSSDPMWSIQPKKPGSKERWEWGFVLYVEDADIARGTVSEKLRVVVNNDAAQHLLKMSASK
jgi:protection-of-telomeres protein 1